MTDSDQTATDRLRAMLDEMGVEHLDGTKMTLWLRDGMGYRALADEGLNGFIHLLLWCTTPEQAIAATLGPGTCRAKLYKPEHGMSDTTICECGELNDISAVYCNRCGGRIVLEEDA